MENITVNMENLSEEEREQLVALIEKANEPQSKMWKPRHGEGYFYLDENAAIHASSGGSSENERHRIAIGNYFKTKEEVEFARRRLEVIHELKELANGFKPSNGREVFYILAYSCNCKVVTAMLQDTNMRYNDIYFETESAAQKAIETIGEKRLKKYYFCIEE